MLSDTICGKLRRVPGVFLLIAAGVMACYGDFVEKPGNNGSVTCNTFCTNDGAYWGPAGKCIGSRVESGGPPGVTSIGCNATMPGAAITCFCQPSRPAPRGDFEKPGNNGSVSCGAFCKNDGAYWGRAGVCAGGRIEQGPGAGGNIDCDDGLGVRGNVVCYCQPPCGPASDSFEKPGNNGTVSCNTFCSNKGANWGAVGTCTGARVESGLWAGQNIACSNVLTEHSGGELGSVVCYCKPPLDYLGCYVDKSSRNLPVVLSSASNLTVEECVEAALAKGLTYAGLQFGGQCYGGNTLLSSDLAPNQGDCNMRCNRDQTEICGGVWRNSIYYSKGDVNRSPGFLGCYQDDRSRKLPVTLSSSSTMTVEDCLKSAQDKQLVYAGLQFGGQCYAGNSLANSTKVDDASCNMPCNSNTPDSQETCGGVWLNSVYASGYPLKSCVYDTDFSSDNYNCGSCGNVCGPKSSCSGGKCVLNCGSLSKCDNYCVNLTNNPNYCGSCANHCAPGWECRGGSCFNPCPAGNCVIGTLPIPTSQSCPASGPQ